jgi:hypothetical protein
MALVATPFSNSWAATAPPILPVAPVTSTRVFAIGVSFPTSDERCEPTEVTTGHIRSMQSDVTVVNIAVRMGFWRA